MQPVEVVALSGLMTLAGVVISNLLAWWSKRGELRHSSSAPGAPTVQEIWQRQDKMEGALRASLVLLGEIGEQWDGPHPPKLSPRAIAVLRDTGYLPPELDNLLPHPS